MLMHCHTKQQGVIYYRGTVKKHLATHHLLPLLSHILLDGENLPLPELSSTPQTPPAQAHHPPTDHAVSFLHSIASITYIPRQSPILYLRHTLGVDWLRCCPVSVQYRQGSARR